MKKDLWFAYWVAVFICFLLFSCNINFRLARQANHLLICDTAVSKGFIGISVYDAATNKYLYNYNADKYFVPASNTKLFTLYAGMKYSGDSLVGLRYALLHDTIFILPSADPTFLHEEFINQKVAYFLETLKMPAVFTADTWRAEKYGRGWAWDDYNETYMPERSAFPLRDNLMKINFTSTNNIQQNDSVDCKVRVIPPEIPSAISYNKWKNRNVSVRRKYDSNDLVINYPGADTMIEKQLPFVTGNLSTALKILHQKNSFIETQPAAFNSQHSAFSIIHSQPSDSLFKPMMHRSDNFFAEQTLLMAGNELLGYLSDDAVIDTLLKTDLKDAPQKPKWIDGSGLSRYNLFTPKDFIYILTKLKNDFGMQRLKNILPTGGEGTLQDYFIADAGFIYAKTGTLSNNNALSGYVFTKKNKLLLFSVLANNYQTGATPVRKAIEKFVQYLRENN